MLLVPNLKVQKELKNEKTITEYQLRQLIKGESQKFKDAVNSLINKSREFKIMTIEALTRRLDDKDMSRFCSFLNELKKMDMVEMYRFAKTLMECTRASAENKFLDKGGQMSLEDTEE